MDSQDHRHDSESEKGTDSNSQQYRQEQIKSPILKSTTSVGIKMAELCFQQYTSLYSKIFFFTTVFMASYAYSLDISIRYVFTSYATSSFSEHSLLSTVNVINGVAAAAAQPTYARLSDMFGRLQIFIVAILFYVVGTVIQSQAYDIQRYAAGSVLYRIGYSGSVSMLFLIVSDFSNLNWRLAALSLTATPFIINTWISGNVSSQLIENHSWNFCIGIWAFIYPLTCLPLLGCMTHMLILAKRTEEWQLMIEEENNKWVSWKKYFIDLFHSLDVIGILCVILVFGLILVPFTTAGGVNSNWKKASVIVPLVLGFCMIPVSLYWENKFAKHPILPYKLMRDRGVWSAMLISMFIDFVWYMPNDYLYTVLTVGLNQSILSATRISNVGSFVSVIVGPIVGLLIAKFRRTKAFIMFGVSVWIISMGLMIHYRGANDGINYKSSVNGIIGANCLMGFGTGFFTYNLSVSIASCTSHEYMGVVMSVSLASYYLGSAFGSAVSGAVWTNMLYKNILNKFLAAGFPASDAVIAYSSPFTFVLTNPWGSEQRQELVKSYAEIQKILCIIGLCLIIPMFAATFCLRDHKLPDSQSLELETQESSDDKRDQNVVLNKNDDDFILKNIRSLLGRK